jgi:hypothetical protein
MFTLVRACELKGDWSMLHELRDQVALGIRFLIQLRDDARRGNSTNGRYGLIAPGFPDGGIAGVHSEFSNTLWVLAGLRAVMRCNENLKLPELDIAASFYRELRGAFDEAAKQEMVADPRGFLICRSSCGTTPTGSCPIPGSVHDRRRGSGRFRM